MLRNIGLRQIWADEALVADPLLGVTGRVDVHVSLRRVQDMGHADLEQVLQVLGRRAVPDNDAFI